MAMVQCPECGREISEIADACPACGYPMAKKRAEESEKIRERERKEKQEKDDRRRKEKRNSAIKIAVAGVALALALYAIGTLLTGGTGLDGRDKLAFDLLVYASDYMNDPRALRIESGYLIGLDDDTALYCKLSSTNAYGARVPAYYQIKNKNGKKSMELVKVEEWERYKYDSKDNLNISRINKALERELGK